MKKILLIEDETNIRSLYAEVLREGGYEVVEISEGMHGLEVAKKDSWDLLLLDIMLPSLDGVEILRRIKADANLSSRPIIIVSNLESEDIKTTCAELGAKEFLVKANIMPKDILLAVKRHVFDK